ncbi:MAG TPA: multicopper oxidase domain-containing protein [Candidatus Xenobia bacterium]|nr:multicopper oxidase domain-containing protein [Candidatus Xenobia bacterium]
MHPLKYYWPRIQRIALRNRQEILRAGLNRRELFKLGLLSSAGYLVAKSGLSAWADGGCDAGECDLGCSPPTIPFRDPLVVPPVLPLRDPNTDPGFTFSPPAATPNRNINPATGIPFEGRTQVHQFRDRFPVQDYFITRLRPNFNATFSDDATNLSRIGPQLVWGFNLGGADASDVALSPGPTVVSRYGRPILIRRFNELSTNTLGFGVPEVSTHLHNFHSGPDSDGGPCDPNTGGNSTNPLVQGRFFFIGQFYDYYHTMARAGFDTPQFSATDGDIRETLTTLWYHDHRVDHTAENVYKGLAGFHFIFNDFDTGDENTGFRFPSFPQFDIPLILTDKLFTPEGEFCFDTFGLDGLVGDKYVTNGKIQPYFEVQKRRYRFRILDGGPSRFYQLYLTNPDNPNQSIPFYAITTTDGNLLPRPIRLTNVRLSVAERIDVIIDFKAIWNNFGNPSRIWLENRLRQDNGRGPTNEILPAGNPNNVVLEFRLTGPSNVADASFDPAPVSFPTVPCSPTDCVFAPICLPPVPTNNAPAKEDRIRITRTFRFERGNGQWQINGQFVDCTRFRFKVERNTAERWILRNNSGGWEHPIHIHFEEFRMVRRNNQLIQCGNVEFGRKDVARLQTNEEIEVLFRFRDFRGGFPMHCHNTIHEDHAMLLLFEIADTGDNKTEP